MQNILITGSAGYIGSVCTYRLLKEGYNIFAFDNLSTGHIETIEKLKKYGNLVFIEGDLKNYSDISQACKNKIDAIIHFAAYSQVNESEKNPIKYYENNISGAINLVKAMLENNIKHIVFSSTAAVYGNPESIPISENSTLKPINVYGKTKLAIEEILNDSDRVYSIKSAKLRYFNACGASDDMIFGEKHNPETHLIPNILKQENLKVFGNDYNTKDGTCIRDYIDVEDLTDAHILALNYIKENNKSITLNLGTKEGCSVSEIIKYCEETIKQPVKYEIAPKREGDPAILVADNLKAKETIGWIPKRSIKSSINKAYEFKKRCSN